MHLVMELCEGGSVLDGLKDGEYSERQVCVAWEGRLGEGRMERQACEGGSALDGLEDGDYSERQVCEGGSALGARAPGGAGWAAGCAWRGKGGAAGLRG